MKQLAPSELILNDDGSIYHLCLKPGDIANTIITVGDQDRVDLISKHFDTIEVRIQNREFKTHTGTLNGKRLTVISTGIGPDNIDIVFNELDALVNIDFTTRSVKETHTPLTFIRIGTSGTVQKDIALDTLLISDIAVGFDNLIRFYKNVDTITIPNFSEKFVASTQWNPTSAIPYAIAAGRELIHQFEDREFTKGITATSVGFYGPQGRSLRLPLYDTSLNEKLATFRFNGMPITNLEMETAAIYAMAKLLGHQAISFNAILANRVTGAFSDTPKETIEKLISLVLSKI